MEESPDLKLQTRSVRRGVYGGIMLAILTVVGVAFVIWLGTNIVQNSIAEKRAQADMAVSADFKSKLHTYRDAVTEEHNAAAIGWSQFQASEKKVSDAQDVMQRGAGNTGERSLSEEAVSAQSVYEGCVDLSIEPGLGTPIYTLKHCEQGSPLSDLSTIVDQADRAK